MCLEQVGQVKWARMMVGNSVFAHIAQSVEHFLGKEEVTGSNPVMSSTFWPDWLCIRSTEFCSTLPKGIVR